MQLKPKRGVIELAQAAGGKQRHQRDRDDHAERDPNHSARRMSSRPGPRAISGPMNAGANFAAAAAAVSAPLSGPERIATNPQTSSAETSVSLEAVTSDSAVNGHAAHASASAQPSDGSRAQLPAEDDQPGDRRTAPR